MLYDQYLILTYLLIALVIINIGLWIKLSNLRHDMWTTMQEIRTLQEHVNYLQNDIIDDIRGGK